MSNEQCKCTFNQRMVGDGCDICNPEKALEYAMDTILELKKHNEVMVNELCRLRDILFTLHLLGSNNTYQKEIDSIEKALNFN